MSMVAVLGALALLAAPSGSADRAADEAALRTAKLQTWPALYRAQDADGLAAFLADEFVELAPDGTIEAKAAAVDWLRRNAWTGGPNDFRYDITRIAFLTDGVANVYGTGSYKAADCTAGQRKAYTSSNLFKREDGRWRPVFSHRSDAVCRAALSKGA